MKKSKILVVEDDYGGVMYLQARLTQLGYEVCGIVGKGEEAIEMARSLKPDLIIMDINLAGSIDGIDAAVAIKRFLNVALIYLTAYEDDATVQKAKLSGPHGYLTKPIDSKSLKTTLEIVLNKFELENKLVESELRYRTLVLTATDGVLTLDEEGAITSCNNRILDMVGYEEKELLGNTIKKILPDVFINHLTVGRKRFLEVGRQTTADTMELYAKHKTGKVFPIELSFSPWEMNNQLFYTLIIRDIHLRKETEDALRRAQEQLENKVAQRSAELGVLIEHSPLAISIFDPDGKITISNAAWEKTYALLNYTHPLQEYNILEEELIKRYGYLDRLSDIFANGGSLTTSPIFLDPGENALPDSEGVILAFRFTAVTDSSGNVYCVVNIVEDMTEQQKAKDSSRELEQQKDYSVLIIENLETERSRIARELHDSVGQLLSAIKLKLEAFAKTGFSNEPLFERSKELVTLAGTEIKNIIYSLHPVFLDAFGLRPAIAALIEELGKSSTVQITLEFEHPESRFDPKVELHLYRIVQESITNLIRHADATEAKITVSLRDDYLYLYIMDNGKGMSQAAEDGKAKKNSFGLINIRQRVNLLDGNFQIDSSADKGTELFIEIPLKAVE